jgi:hypothetical protein
MNTMTAIGRPIINGVISRPTPTSAKATSPAARSPRHRVSSTLSPAKPSSAGSRVTDATTVTATVVAALTARPYTYPRPISTMPSREITTVAPAKTADRPAVSIAIRIDSRIGCPSWSCSR